MSFIHLWPLVLLLLIPLVIIMYLLKQNATDTPVPSIFLWKEMYQNKESDTPWEKLKKNILLIMQIITIIVLVLALMGPYIRKEIDVTESVAILIDNSAGMGTKLDERDTRLDKAKASALSFVDSLPSGTRITLISCNKDTSVLISNSQDKVSVNSLIKGISQTNYAGDVSAGIKLCNTFRISDPALQVAAFTDTYVALPETSGTIYNFCGNVQNACVDYVSCGTSGDKTVVLASVSNCGSEELVTDLNLYIDDELVAVQSVEIPANQSQVVYFDSLSLSGDVVKVEINNKDALMLDNVAYALTNNETAAKVLLMTSGNLFLQRAIELMDNIKVSVGTEVEDFETLAKENYDLIIFDNCIPENLENILPEKGNLMFINVPFDKYYTVAKELEYIQPDENGEGGFVPTVSFDSTKYTQNIKSSSFGFSSVKAMEFPIWAENLMTVKDENGIPYSAGFMGENDYRKLCVLGFDLHASDMVLKMEFPVFIYSIMSSLADTSALSDKNVFCGDTVKISSLSENGFTLSKPKGFQKSYSSGILNFKETEEPGIYILNSGKASQEFFIVNFPTTESHSSGFGEVQNDSNFANFSIVDATEQGVFSYRPYIIGLILLLLMAEWIIFIRK